MIVINISYMRFDIGLTYKFMAEESSEENIDFLESQQMNAEQENMFRTITRSKSNDSLIGRLISHPNDFNERSVVFDYLPLPPLTNYTPTIIINRATETEVVKNSDGNTKCERLRIFKKVKKTKIRGKCDYQKNICGYITKKIIREFIGKSFQSYINSLCQKFGCTYKQCKSFYLSKIEHVTGPSHLPELLVVTASDQNPTPAVKRVFRQFYRWFIKQRYLRYLLLQGKMQNKSAYIEYKNSHLFHIVDQAFQKDIQLGSLGRTRSRRKSHKQQIHE